MFVRYPPMGNASWVCFDCRESVRRPCHYEADVPCPRCAQICRCIGTKIPVPPKRDAKAWRELRESLDANAIRFAESQHRRQIRQRRSLGKEIKRAGARANSEGRPKETGNPPQKLIESELTDDSVQPFLLSYVEGLPKEVAELHRLLEQQNLADLRAVLHRLKGTGGLYGFMPITERAASAEQRIRENDPLERIAADVEDLVGIIRCVKSYDPAKERSLTSEKR